MGSVDPEGDAALAHGLNYPGRSSRNAKERDVTTQSLAERFTGASERTCSAYRVADSRPELSRVARCPDTEDL
jgi:hypothetical protein